MPCKPPRYFDVSIHAPAWGATKHDSRDAASRQFQFTLPRGERQLPSLAQQQFAKVSIHAPAWGATPRPGVLPASQVVSIHAPAWGATFWPILASRPFSTFQFTLPRGERRDRKQTTVLEFPFQFTLPRGERLLTAERDDNAARFQFTLPRGERLGELAENERRAGFNSRSRVGSDL